MATAKTKAAPTPIPMAVEFTQARPRADDGVQLHIHKWTPADATIRAEVLILHGYAEHGARYRELAHCFADHGIVTIAVDFRGHGRSEGQRGFVEDFQDYHRDVDTAIGELGTVPKFLLGHSHGGLIALDYVAMHSTSFKGLIVTNPFLDLGMPVPPVKVWLGKVMARLYPRLSLPSGLDPNGISRDATVVEAYARDPMVFTTANAGWYSQVQPAQQRVRRLTSLPLPYLYVYSDSDPITSVSANRALAEQLGGDDKTVWLRQGELHEVLNELDRTSLHAEITAWILERL